MGGARVPAAASGNAAALGAAWPRQITMPRYRGTKCMVADYAVLAEQSREINETRCPCRARRCSRRWISCVRPASLFAVSSIGGAEGDDALSMPTGLVHGASQAGAAR